MIYRKATAKDLEGICQLRAQLAYDPAERFATEYAPYHPENDRAWIQKCLRSKQKVILIAEDSDSICGHSIIAIETVPERAKVYYTYRKKAVLAHLYVAIKKRHQGIGTDLLEYTLKYLKQQGVEFVDLDCYIGNKEAEALYKKVGLKDVFVRKRYSLK